MADAKDPALPTKTMRAPDFQAMWRDTADWFAVHYMQILIAIGAAIVIYLLLATLKGLGKRYKGSRGDTIGYTNVLGRTVSKTTHFFMVMVSARLVAGYADAPPVDHAVREWRRDRGGALRIQVHVSGWSGVWLWHSE